MLQINKQLPAFKGLNSDYLMRLLCIDLLLFLYFVEMDMFQDFCDWLVPTHRYEHH